MNTNEAKREVARRLEEMGVTAQRLSAKTWHFPDLGGGSRMVVTITGALFPCYAEEAKRVLMEGVPKPSLGGYSLSFEACRFEPPHLQVKSRTISIREHQLAGHVLPTYYVDEVLTLSDNSRSRSNLGSNADVHAARALAHELAIRRGCQVQDETLKPAPAPVLDPEPDFVAAMAFATARP